MSARYNTIVSRVVERLNAGRILMAHNALAHEDTTVGPYTEAVDRGFHFAVIGWRGRCPSGEARTAREAAELFVDRVGTGRAREAVLKSL